jgi:hypothetical protein
MRAIDDRYLLHKQEPTTEFAFAARAPHDATRVHEDNRTVVGLKRNDVGLL